MKYIRTKNGLVLYVSEKITDIYGTYYLYDNDTKWFESEIIKVADTIEELCDEFVAVRKSDNAKRLGKIDCIWFKEQTGWIGRLEDYKSIYGAVWIEGPDGEPILKPIAKTNDEGELELI